MMTPRPLMRKKSFWLGILVLGFLTFGWARSMSYQDNLSWSMGNRHHGISQRLGSIEFYRLVFPLAIGDGLKVTTTSAGDLPDKGLVPAIAWKSDGDPGFVQHRGVFVAHWFLILLSLVAWLGWLGLRWRLEHRSQDS